MPDIPYTQEDWSKMYAVDRILTPEEFGALSSSAYTTIPYFAAARGPYGAWTSAYIDQDPYGGYNIVWTQPEYQQKTARQFIEEAGYSPILIRSTGDEFYPYSEVSPETIFPDGIVPGDNYRNVITPEMEASLFSSGIRWGYVDPNTGRVESFSIPGDWTAYPVGYEEPASYGRLGVNLPDEGSTGGISSYIKPTGMYEVVGTEHTNDLPAWYNSYFTAEEDDGFLGGLGGIASMLGSAIPGPWTPFTTALGAISAIDSGNPLGILGAALGGYNLLSGSTGGISGLLGGDGGGISGISDVGQSTGLWGSNMDLGDIGNYLGDLVTSGDISMDEAMQAMQAYNNAASGGDWGAFLSDQAAGLTQLPGLSLIDSAMSTIRNLGIDPVSTLGKSLLSQLTSSGASGGLNLSGLLGTGLTGLGSYLAGQTATDAADKLANAQLEAARIAADAAKFRPVGVTTRFGGSQFQYDPQGNLISAGYTVAPDIAAQREALLGASGGLLGQFTGAQAATAPMGVAGQRAMQLGQGYLATTPQEQAAKYLAEQQSLLAPYRERELATLQNKLVQQGRLGLATGGTTTGMMAANPELEAWYNAKRMQDLNLAAQATQGGMDFAKFGTGMVGTGGDLLRSMYGAQTAAYQPYQTAMGGASYLEGLGQQPMDIGVNIGAKGTAGTAQAGSLLSQGMLGAAQTQQQAASNPWANFLGMLGGSMQQYQPQQQAPINYQQTPYSPYNVGSWGLFSGPTL